MLLHIIILITVIIISLIFKYYIFNCQLFQKQILEGLDEPTVIAASTLPALDGINSNQQDLIEMSKKTDKLTNDLIEQNIVLSESNIKLDKEIKQQNVSESEFAKDEEKFKSILKDNTAATEIQTNNLVIASKNRNKIAADIAAEDAEEEKKKKKNF